MLTQRQIDDFAQRAQGEDWGQLVGEIAALDIDLFPNLGAVLKRRDELAKMLVAEGGLFVCERQSGPAKSRKVYGKHKVYCGRCGRYVAPDKSHRCIGR